MTWLTFKAASYNTIGSSPGLGLGVPGVTTHARSTCDPLTTPVSLVMLKEQSKDAHRTLMNVKVRHKAVNAVLPRACLGAMLRS